MKWARGWVVLGVAAAIGLTAIGVDIALSPKVGEHVGDQYSISCLDGDLLPCMAIGMPRDARGEPWVALHPKDPNVVAVAAIGRSHEDDAHQALGPQDPEPEPSEVEFLQYFVNRTTGQGAPGPAEPPPSGEPCVGISLCLHSTDDGGATWVARRFPSIDGSQPFTADPTTVFDDAGILHVVGIPGSGLYYSKTADLGRTWSVPLELAPKNAGADRPFLSIHGATLVLTFQTASEGVGPAHVVFSTDGGATWQPVEAFAPPCSLQTPAVHLEGPRWLVACVAAPDFDVHVFHVDLEIGAVGRASTVDGPSGIPMVSRDESGRITMVSLSRTGLFGTSILARTSADEGRSWGLPVDLVPPLKFADWDWYWLGWAATDRQGVAHVLLVGGDGEYCRNQRCDDVGASHSVVWFAADPMSGDILGEALLGSGARDRPADANAHVTDDYHHIVPSGDGVLFAWGHDGNVEVAFARPVT